MRNPRQVRPLCWILFLLLMLPLLAACGGESDDNDDGLNEVAATTVGDAAPTQQADSEDADPTATEADSAAADATPTEGEAAAPTATEAQAANTPATDQTDVAMGDKVLRIHQVYYPTTIDPQKSSWLEEISVLMLNYEGLTKLDENLQTIPGAAESWEYNDEATQLTFTLRDDLTYSDGSPLRAENFRYAVQRTCDPNTAGDYQSILFDIVGCAEFAETDPADAAAYEAARDALGVEAPNDTTLVIDLNQPAPYYHTVAAIWVFFPVKQEIVEQADEAWWQQPELHVGNGPFRIVRIEEGQLISFAANENYRGGRPNLDGIEFVYQPDTTVALEAYRQGQLHMVLLDSSQIAAVSEDSELSPDLVQYMTAVTMYFMFNLTKEPFDDLKVREAFAYAFDRETWCAQIRSGECSPTYSFIPEGVPGNIDTDKFAFDPEAAREALAASSYGGPEAMPEITISYASDNPAEQPRMEWLAGQFRDILGVTIVLEPLESTTWVATLDDPEVMANLTVLGWGQDYADPQNWLSVVWTCDGMNSAAGFCSEEYDRLTTLGDTTIDQEERLQYYEQAGELLVDELPAIFTENTSSTFLVSPSVTGYNATVSDWGWPGEYSSVTTIDIED